MRWLSFFLLCVCACGFRLTIPNLALTHLSNQTTEHKMNDCHQAWKATIQRSFSLPTTRMLVHTIPSDVFLLLSYSISSIFPFIEQYAHKRIYSNVHTYIHITIHERRTMVAEAERERRSVTLYLYVLCCVVLYNTRYV